MGIINGHARPIAGGGGIPGRFADHSSVTCTGVTGRLWVCCGVPPAGAIICTGQGSTRQADCISTPATAAPSLNDTAGILQGVTGVCHQAANRILFSAGLALNNAGCRGLAQSVAMYGPTGIPIGRIKAALALAGNFNALIIFMIAVKATRTTDWVNKLNACVNVVGDIPQCLPPGPGQAPVTPVSDMEQEYIAAILKLYYGDEMMSDDDKYDESLIMQFTQGLSDDHKEELRVPILKLINANITAHAKIVSDFLTREIGTEEFAIRINKNAVQMQSNLLELLGPDQYHKVMYAEPGEFYNLLDMETAHNSYGEAFKLDQL